MRRWTSWAWGGNCDKPIADGLSARLVADAAGLDRAQTEDTPKSGNAALLNTAADIKIDANLAHPLTLTLAQNTDIAVFPALKSA